MSSEVTEIQASVVEFMKAFFLKHGKMPTVREIGTELFKVKTTNGVKGHLDRLAAKGVIILGSGKSRSTKIVGWNPIGENSDSRTGENYTVNLVSGNRVAFMIFSDEGMVESGIYGIEQAVKMADQIKAPAELAVIDRLVKVAEFLVKRRITAKVAAE
jgi:SOS-response transcriptional repressor LexA